MDVLQSSGRPSGLPSHAKWLSGEGAGSWFVIAQNGSDYTIKRYSDDGNIECEGIFKTTESFDINHNYELTYPSHCAKVSVIQRNVCFVFETIV
ncbi:MAG: hypothetical protein ACI8SE_001920 [Bacteroidia bacterium]|jgi:hypothetical protein